MQDDREEYRSFVCVKKEKKDVDMEDGDDKKDVSLEVHEDLIFFFFYLRMCISWRRKKIEWIVPKA